MVTTAHPAASSQISAAKINRRAHWPSGTNASAPWGSQGLMNGQPRKYASTAAAAAANCTWIFSSTCRKRGFMIADCPKNAKTVS